ncbi:hypothetical protein [Paenibacillus sp. FSL H3-0333]|uniref:hypothetical protein n=1 Tax=Paenibacillus sp. FSL H3-0333 TaxID=2921373 RepID=UPI0030F5A265
MSKVQYDIIGMMSEMKDLGDQIKSEFAMYLNTLQKVKTDYNDGLASIVRITCYEDINKIMYGAGFYVILTNYKIDDNHCDFVIDELKAIYRGHSFTTKARVKSHIFNKQYKADEQKAIYKVCMKIDDRNGINIDEYPYCNFDWYILQLNMNGSNKFVREKAEEAFLETFGRPLGSKR